MCIACMVTRSLTIASPWHASSAHYDCRELGFMPVEVNASDTRNKADKSAKTGMGGKLSNAIKELANNTALNMAQDGRRKKVRPTSHASLPASCTRHAPVPYLPLDSFIQADKGCAPDNLQQTAML